MTPETASWHEWLRLAMALAGLAIAWRGRALVLGQRFLPPLGASLREVHTAEHEWDERMALFREMQWSIAAVHMLLLINVATNLFYPSSPLEQPNIATSNIMQIAVPGILIRASELVSSRVRSSARAMATMARDYSEEAAP